MGTEEFDRETLECGCVITQWSDDWLRGGFGKRYCETHRLENIEKHKLNKKKLENLKDEYQYKPSKLLVEDIIQVQITLLSADINCPCCNKQYQNNNIKRHIKSKDHQKKLNKLNNDI